MRVIPVIATVIFILAVGPAAVRADTTEVDKQAAAAHYRQGRVYADAGDFDHAIAEYVKANELLPKPLLLFHIAEAYRLKGDSREALKYYQQYLEAEPDGKPAGAARQYATSITHDIESQEATKDSDGDGVPDLRDRCPAIAAHTPDGCPGDRDGDGVPDDRDRCPDTAAAGTPDGCPRDGDGDGVPDDRDRCPTVAAATADGCPAAPAGGGGMGSRRRIALAVGGVGIAALVTSGIFGLYAMSQWNDAQNTCTTRACDAVGHDKAESASSAATLSTITFGVGAAALATGIYLYVTAPKDGPAQSDHARVTPTVGNGAVGVIVTGSF